MTPDCALCPRLVQYRRENRAVQPQWHNAPALPFGDPQAWLLIAGLAPGRTGANRTGRVFTGDAAGRMLFETLIATGFATGDYSDDAEDDIRLHGCMITNALLCAPPGNRPLPAEEAACRPHLKALITSLPRLKVIVTLGDIALRNVLKALGQKPSAMRGGHGATARFGSITVVNSYHCSRLNLNTGRLTPAMFAALFQTVKSRRRKAPSV
jgi:uracil-DNA glycosylase